jgi:uncharacterized membrane protein
MEIDRLFGLPAHPLLVHIPVVLIPTALLATILALWPPIRRAALITAAALAAVGAMGAVLAVGAGEKLEDGVRESERVEEHAEQGERVELPAIAFGLLAIGTAVAVESVHRNRNRGTEDDDPASTSGRLPAGAVPVGTSGGPGGPVPTAPGTVATAVRAPAASASSTPRARHDRMAGTAARWVPALLALSLLVGAYTTYTVVQAGHSGADATWHDTGDARPGADVPPGGDVDADGD